MVLQYFDALNPNDQSVSVCAQGVCCRGACACGAERVCRCSLGRIDPNLFLR